MIASRWRCDAVHIHQLLPLIIKSYKHRFQTGTHVHAALCGGRSNAPPYRDSGHGVAATDHSQTPGSESAGPGRLADHAAEVDPLERGVLIREDVVVDGTKRAVRPVLHAVVEGLDDVFLEVFVARMRLHNRV